MTFRSLYHTEVINDAGLNGHARVTLGGDFDVLTSSPLQDDPLGPTRTAPGISAGYLFKRHDRS